jgi:dihydrofolate synthase/folylpolyglutamate synthase
VTAAAVSYAAAVERLFGFERGGGALGLEGTRLLLRALDHPERRFAAVHVAGTNGKGSTCCYLERLLRETGLRTGLYTSPHLVDFRERIRLHGRAADGAVVAALLDRIAALPESRGRTFFEAATAIAFGAFAGAGVDAAVVEVGLGGRLDSTNVIAPGLCVITPIGLDHTDLLGATLRQVAGEKAGILKRGVPAIAGAQAATASSVLRHAAREAGTLIAPASSRVRVLSARPTPDGTEVTAKSRDFGRLTFRLRALGRHQAANAALALAAFGEACARGLARPEGGTLCVPTPEPRRIEAALAAARWPGRLERSAVEPRIFWDGAHNPHGARALRRAWREAMNDAPAVLVIGCSSDKDVTGLLRALAGPWRTVIATAPRSPRALAPEALAERVDATLGGSVVAVDGVAGALARALELAGPRGHVLVAGSLFTVGEAMQAVGDPPPEALP